MTFLQYLCGFHIVMKISCHHEFHIAFDWTAAAADEAALIEKSIPFWEKWNQPSFYFIFATPRYLKKLFLKIYTRWKGEE